MPFKCVVPGCRSNYYHVKGSPSVPMQRYPTEADRIKAWNDAISRPGFAPTAHSHVCIKHFTDDQLLVTDQRVRIPYAKRGGCGPVSRKVTKLKPNAVPCMFEVDPSTHKMRSCYRAAKRHVDRRSRECEILAGFKVEFKPEMWEENGDKTNETEEEGPPSKRARGRPKKHIVRTEGNVSVKSEVIFCCALACTNTSENFVLNSLPKDPALRALWVEKIDRLDWSPDDDSALCEVHFEEEMWDQDLDSKRVLRPDAVPSLFLHGEAIKSWVTMDNTGNIADIIVDGRSTNDEESTNGESTQGNMESVEGSEQDEDEDSSLFVKREALEPEIDMVEGSEEDMVSRDTSAEEQFETIYCDSTFNDQEDSEDGHFNNKEDDNSRITPTSFEEENPLADSVPSWKIIPPPTHTGGSSPILQDGEVSCLEDSTNKAKDSGSKYMVISMASKDNSNDKVIRRRSSNQLTDEFQCPICDRRLSRRKNLEIHIEKLHPFGEISEYQKKKKELLKEEMRLKEIRLKEMQKLKEKPLKSPAFKKPPPGLTPIPQCLFSPSTSISQKTPDTAASTSGSEVLKTPLPVISFSQSPLISSSIKTTPSTIVTPTLVASQPLITTQPLIPTPTGLITSPGIIPSSTAGTPLPLISTSSFVSTANSGDPSPAGGEMRKQFLLLLPKQSVIPKPKRPPKNEDTMYSVDLSEMTKEKRVLLKEKLKELVDAVIKKNLNPDKIIIAYDRT